jgi:hypothetical protein
LLPATGQAEPTRGVDLYRSPTFGYLVHWDATRWTVDEQFSQDGRDVLRLRDAANLIEFQGDSAAGGDARACLDDSLAELLADPAVRAVSLASDENGPFAWETDQLSYAIFTYRLAAEGEPIQLARYVECVTLIPEVAVLRKSHTGAAEQFVDAFFAVNPIFGAVILPRAAWELASADRFRPTAGWDTVPIAAGSHAVVRLEFDETGSTRVEPLGSVWLELREWANEAALQEPPPGHHFASLTVTFSHEYGEAGSAAYPADPSTLLLQDQFDTVYRASRSRWDQAPGDGDLPVQELPAQATATATNYYLLPDDVRVASILCRCTIPRDRETRFERREIRPRAGTVLASPERQGPWSSIVVPTIYLDRAGTEAGMVSVLNSRAMSSLLSTTSDATDEQQTAFPVLFAFYNTGSGPLVVDPHDLFAASVGGIATPRDAFWEMAPGASSGQRQTLAPGDVAALWVTFDLGEGAEPYLWDLYYSPAADQLVPLGGLTSGGAGGAGRPIITVSEFVGDQSLGLPGDGGRPIITPSE